MNIEETLLKINAASFEGRIGAARGLTTVANAALVRIGELVVDALADLRDEPIVEPEAEFNPWRRHAHAILKWMRKGEGNEHHRAVNGYQVIVRYVSNAPGEWRSIRLSGKLPFGGEGWEHFPPNGVSVEQGVEAFVEEVAQVLQENCS